MQATKGFRGWIAVVLAVLTIVVFPPSTAWGQGGASGANLSPEQIQKNLEEAKQRYNAGLKLYDDGAFEAARVQFERAYELAPSYKILYNIGLVYKQTNDFVSALKNFQKYLTDGGASVPDDRKTEVKKYIDQLKTVVASVRVTTNVPGVDVAVDDAVVGKSPITDPILLNPGRRKISGTKEGRMPQAKVITVASGDTVDVKLDLAEPPKQIIRQGVDWRPVVGWSVTAAFGIAAGIAGYLTVRANSDLSDMRNARGGGAGPSGDPTVRSQLDDQYNKMKTYALITDILTGAAVIAGGVSIYLTFFAGKKSEQQPTPGGATPTTADTLRLQVGPTSASLVGNF